MDSKVKQGYKQTEVGIIPEDWELVYLRDLVKPSHPITYGVLKPGDFYSDGIPLLQIQDILHKKIDVSKLHRISAKLDNQYSRTKLSGGEIVVSLVGTIGKFALIPDYLSGANLHRNLAKIFIDQKKAFTQYVYHYLLSEEIKNAISLNTFGSTQALFNLFDLRHLTIALPPIAEQEKIAEALSDVDSLIESLEELIAKKRHITQGAMQELLTGKRRLIDNGQWKLEKLGDIAKIIMGQSPSSVNYRREEKGLPLIQGNADIFNRKALKRIFTTELTKEAKKGDIIMSVRAPVGEIARTSFDACIGRGVCAIRYPNNFLYHLLIFKEATWSKLSKGSTFDSVNSTDIKNLEILVPPTKAEQEAIAEVLTDMDNEITALEEKLQKTRHLKQGMMQELLTGKTRLI